MNLFLVLLSFLLMTSSVEAKDAVSKFAINSKMGYFLPKSDSDVDEYYGGGQVIAMGGEYNFSPAFSMALNLDYKKLESNEKEKVLGVENIEIAKVEEDYLRIIPITFSLIYKILPGTQKVFLLYTGGGIGVYLANLTFTVSEIPNPYDWTIVRGRGKFPSFKVTKSNPSDIKSAKATGFHLLAGFKHHLFSHLFLNGEIKYASAPVSEWNNIDLGGITITGGINYSF